MLSQRSKVLTLVLTERPVVVLSQRSTVLSLVLSE